MTRDNVQSLASAELAEFEYGGACGKSYVRRRGGVLLLVFDGDQRLSLAVRTGLREPFGELQTENVLVCGSEPSGCGVGLLIPGDG